MKRFAHLKPRAHKRVLQACWAINAEQKKFRRELGRKNVEFWNSLAEANKFYNGPMQ